MSVLQELSKMLDYREQENISTDILVIGEDKWHALKTEMTAMAQPVPGVPVGFRPTFDGIPVVIDSFSKDCIEAY